MQPTYNDKQPKLKLITTVIAIVIIAGVIVFIDHLNAIKSNALATTTSGAPTTAQPTTIIGSDSTAVTSTTSTSSSGYKDGTYTASSDYYVPHGSEEIDVTLTVKDGVITDSTITNSEGDHDSIRYQEDFASAYKSYVVGQKLNAFKLGIISGASDTTDGFNDAISQIATKAQA